MRFEAFVAARYLRASPGQTFLTVGAVAIAVTVVVFINSLIGGLQTRLLRDNVGALPHITVRPAPPDPTPLQDLHPPEAGTLYTSQIQKFSETRRDLENPERVVQQLSLFEGVTVLSPAVRGQAFLVRGARRFGVTVSGADPPRQERIVGLQDDLVAGRWLDLGPDEVVMGFRLAGDAGVRLGDRVRLVSAEGVTEVFRVAGIFDTGSNAVDQGQVFLTLRAAQALFRTGRNVSSIQLKLREPFQADRVALSIRSSLGFEADSWMQQQAMFVNGFRAQDQSRMMISFFSLLASAFGIASVLIVSVVRKSREIGILKSMGTRDRQIMGIFTLQGLFVSLLGSAVGCAAAWLLLDFLSGIRQVARFGKTDQLFPVSFEPSLFLYAAAAAILSTMLASLLPARRAAMMNPVEVLRGE